jgi:hypothetical protein
MSKVGEHDIDSLTGGSLLVSAFPTWEVAVGVFFLGLGWYSNADIIIWNPGHNDYTTSGMD